MTVNRVHATPETAGLAASNATPMSGARGIRFPVQPRLVSSEKVARRLGVTLAVFIEKLPHLRSAGFPLPDAILGNYNLVAVDRWIDNRSGLTKPDDPVSDPATILARVREKRWAR